MCRLYNLWLFCAFENGHELTSTVDRVAFLLLGHWDFGETKDHEVEGDGQEDDRDHCGYSVHVDLKTSQGDARVADGSEK